MAYGQPYKAYQTTGVKTSSQKQLIVMLYEGMNKFMNRAIKAIQEEEIEVAHHNLNKTGKILLELLGTLREDKGGEIAANLKKIYVHCYEQIVIANLKKDITLIKEIQKILSNLGEGWKQISAAGRAPMAGQTMTPGQIRITG